MSARSISANGLKQKQKNCNSNYSEILTRIVIIEKWMLMDFRDVPVCVDEYSLAVFIRQLLGVERKWTIKRQQRSEEWHQQASGEQRGNNFQLFALMRFYTLKCLQITDESFQTWKNFSKISEWLKTFSHRVLNRKDSTTPWL